MGTGYTRNDTANNIADGNVINASDLDGEFDAIQAAFNATTGHSHDGTTGEGPQIGTGGIADLAVTTGKIANDAVTLGTKTSGNYVATLATGAGLDGSASSEGATPTISLNLNELTTSVSDGDGDYFVVVDTLGAQKKLTKANIAVSGFDTTNGIALGTDTTGNYIATGAVSGVGLSGSASAEGATFTVTSNATDANTASTIVARDASGNFSAGTITASLTGTASNANTLDSLDSTQFLRSDAADTKTSGDLSFSDNVKATFGAGNDLQIYHDGVSTSYIKASSDLFLQGTDDVVIRDASTLEEHIRCNLNDSVEISYDGSVKLATTSTGINVTGTTYTDGIRVEDDGSGSPLVNIRADDGNPWAIRVANDTYSTGANDGWGVYVQNTGTVTHEVRGNAAYLPMTFIQNNGGASREVMRIGDTGYFRALYQGSTRLDTTSAGIDVTGTITFDGGTTSADLNFGDGDKAVFGAGSDLSIYHNGTHSFIAETNAGGNLYIDAETLHLRDATGDTWLRGVANDRVELYHNGSEKLRTTSVGIDVTGEVQADSLDIDGAADISGLLNMSGGNIRLGDSSGSNVSRIQLGASQDLAIFHDGSNSYISDGGTGSLYVQGTNLNLRSGSGENFITMVANGNTALYYDNVAKLETTNYGIDISGSVVADTHSAGSITGAQTPNFSTYQNFVWTLTGNITLSNPTTEKTGQSGFFIFIHSGAARTVSLGTDFETAGGAGLTLSSTAGAVDIVPYVVQSSGNILLGTPQLAFS